MVLVEISLKFLSMKNCDKAKTEAKNETQNEIKNEASDFVGEIAYHCDAKRKSCGLSLPEERVCGRIPD